MPGSEAALTMSEGEFDHFMSTAEKALRAEAIEMNDAFVAAMGRAVLKGKEKVRPGTFKDNSPMLSLRRYGREPRLSPCGSPGAMCIETGEQGGGAVTLK